MLSDDKRLQRYPELLAELQQELQVKTAYAGIAGKKSGAKQLKDYGMSVADTNLDLAVRGLDYGLAAEIIEDGRGTLYSDLEADKKLAEIPQRIARQSFENIYTQNPKQAIEGLDKGAYDTVIVGYQDRLDENGLPVPIEAPSGLTEKDKRSMRSFAKQELSNRQIATAEQISLPDSDYSKLSPDAKIKWLDEQVRNGNMSKSTHKTETNAIRNPQYIDQTSEMREWLLGYSMQGAISAIRRKKII